MNNDEILRQHCGILCLTIGSSGIPVKIVDLIVQPGFVDPVFFLGHLQPAEVIRGHESVSVNIEISDADSLRAMLTSGQVATAALECPRCKVTGHTTQVLATSCRTVRDDAEPFTYRILASLDLSLVDPRCPACIAEVNRLKTEQHAFQQKIARHERQVAILERKIHKRQLALDQVKMHVEGACDICDSTREAEAEARGWAYEESYGED